MTYNFLDTSAVLNGAISELENCSISIFTLIELEHIKDDKNKTEEVRKAARQALKQISSQNLRTVITDKNVLKKIFKKYNFLQEINDHYIIAAAQYLSDNEKEIIHFYTNDRSQYLFASQLPNLRSHLFTFDNKLNEQYKGWREVHPSEMDLASLYAHPENNIFHLNTNEYMKVIENGKIVDIEKWNGQKYVSIVYKDVHNKFLNETLRPRNVEQKMAFDLLQDSNIPVKLLTGAPGAGKDITMIYNALDLIQRGEKEKIIFIRNLIPFKDAPEIGFLSGDMQDKISWGLGPIRSILGEEGLLQYEEQGLIEAVNLGFIRGCQYNNSIIYVSEGQNITGGGYKLLVSRCGENSELWVNGDILQTDHKKFEENNGITRLIDSLKNNSLFGMVELVKTERSLVADLARVI